MAKRFTTQQEHDDVIIASSVAYERYKTKGLLISTNLTGQPTHDIGNGCYPDLVIWNSGGEYGQTEIIEEIETSETVGIKAANKWKRYSNFGFTFYLIVPFEYSSQAIALIKDNNISIDMLQCYKVDKQGQIIFLTVNGNKLWPLN